MLRIVFGLILIFFSPIVKGQTGEDWGKYGYQTMPSGTKFFPFEQSAGKIYFCAEEKSAGLIWERGAWRQTNFKGITYVLKKLDHLASGNKKWIPCGNAELTDSCSPSGCILNRCYEMKVMGNNNEVPPSGCTEYYSSLDSGRELNIVTCGEFPYDPRKISIISDGSFTIIPLSSNPTPSTEGEGLWVSYGKCTKM